MKKILMLSALFIGLSSALFGQKGMEQKDPFKGILFPPEVIMKNQKELGINKDQRKTIIKESQEAQNRASDAQWDLIEKMEELKTMIAKANIDEEKTMNLLNEILALEAKIKKSHMLLAIRIKNLLSQDQQTLLAEMI